MHFTSFVTCLSPVVLYPEYSAFLILPPVDSFGETFLKSQLPNEISAVCKDLSVSGCFPSRLTSDKLGFQNWSHGDPEASHRHTDPSPVQYLLCQCFHFLFYSLSSNKAIGITSACNYYIVYQVWFWKLFNASSAITMLTALQDLKFWRIFSYWALEPPYAVNMVL